MTFHESYGDVSRAQLAAYKRHNVSPSDHDQLVQLYGDNYQLITRVVKDVRYHLAGSKSFSLWMLLNN
jgi:hypothetical protein